MAFLIPAMAEDGGTYTLMNIPYADFYRSEGAADVGLDAVSSATFNKPRTMGLSDGSYHVNADGSDITGIIYPVYVQNLADLETLGGREITDASSVDITVTNRGKTTTTTYTGRDALYEAPSYSYSNLTINQPESWAMGLFGCAANAEIGNFTLENASVDAAMMGADVVGYAYCTTVSDVTLLGGKVTAHFGEMNEEGMFAGIVGAGMGSMIVDCAAQADIVLPDGMANAGIVGGGLEMTSLVNCAATGTITAGNDCYGLGSISGCGFAAEQFTDCVAEDVTIAAGDNCYWIGGITGYAGGYPDAQYGMPVTVFTNCVARNVSVTTGENADGIGDIVGSGFYNETVAETNGTPFDKPTEFELVNCAVESEAK